MVRVERRTLLQLASAAIASHLSTGQIVAAQSAQEPTEWPQFQATTENTAAFPTGTAPSRGVSQEWQFTTFGDLDILNAPVVAGDTIFLAARDLTLYAVSAATGEKRWQYELGAELMVTPAVGSGKLFVPTRNALMALSTDTGENQWAFEYPQQGVEGQVTYADGAVIPPIGPLTVLNASNGSVRWQKELHPGLGVAVANDTVYVGEAATNRVYAFSLADGSRQWRQGINGRVEQVVSPVVRDGQLYLVSKDQTLFALDAKTGETLWTYAIGGSKSRSTPSVTTDTVYIGEAPPDDDTRPIQQGAVHAVDTATGEQKWRTETPGAVVDSPSVVDNIVYVGSRGEDDANRLHALDIDSGEPHWQRKTRESVHAHAIANGTLYVTTGDGYLQAFSEQNTTATTKIPAPNTTTIPQSDSSAGTDTTVTQPGSNQNIATTTRTRTRQSTTVDAQRQRGFFTNGNTSTPNLISSAFNLTVLGFLLSVAGIIHQMLQGR